MFEEVLLWLAALMLLTVGHSIFFNETSPVFQGLDSHTKHEWVGRVTSSIATAGIVIASIAVSCGGSYEWGMAFALAYFLHDTGHMALYESDWTHYIHHVLSITVWGLTYLVMTPEQAGNAIKMIGILESTSPIVSLSWLLKRAGYMGHPLFKYFAGFMVVFFGLMRCAVFPWFMATRMDKVSAAVVSPLLGLNVYWFWKIIKLAQKTLKLE